MGIQNPSMHFGAKYGTGRLRRLSAAVFVSCSTICIAILSIAIWQKRKAWHVLEAPAGHWIFVPSASPSDDQSNGLLYPESGASADELYPDFLKSKTDSGDWVYLRSPDDKVEDEVADSNLPSGVNWGALDCGFYGPKYESRALGCDRPGMSRRLCRVLFFSYLSCSD